MEGGRSTASSWAETPEYLGGGLPTYGPGVLRGPKGRLMPHPPSGVPGLAGAMLGESEGSRLTEPEAPLHHTL